MDQNSKMYLLNFIVKIGSEGANQGAFGNKRLGAVSAKNALTFCIQVEVVNRPLSSTSASR